MFSAEIKEDAHHIGKAKIGRAIGKWTVHSKLCQMLPIQWLGLQYLGQGYFIMQAAETGILLLTSHKSWIVIMEKLRWCEVGRCLQTMQTSVSSSRCVPSLSSLAPQHVTFCFFDLLLSPCFSNLSSMFFLQPQSASFLFNLPFPPPVRPLFLISLGESSSFKTLIHNYMDRGLG